MQTATITSTVDLTDSGCNACGLVEDTVYTLAMNGVDIPLDSLTVAHLIAAIVSRNGYKQELAMDMMDEYIIYRNGQQAVTFKEEYNQLAFENEQETMTTKNKYATMPELFETVNKVLTKIFNLAAVEFVIE